jgi:hypothetical protein
VPDLSYWKSSEITVETSTETAKLTVAKSVFQSDVGKVAKVLLLIAELVSTVRFFSKI